MGIDVRTLLRGASQAGSAYLAGRRDREAAEREEMLADQERATAKGRDAENTRRYEQSRQDDLKRDAAESARQLMNDRREADDRARELARQTAADGRAAAEEARRVEAARRDAEAHEQDLRYARARADEAELEGRGRSFESAPAIAAEAANMSQTVGDTILDPADMQSTMMMIQRNALIRQLINELGMTPEQAEAEATRRMGRGS